jgi:hypothetical protein
MAGEPQIDVGAYVTCQAAQSVADGAWNTQTPTKIVNAITAAPYQKAPLLDFQVVISVGTPVENSTMEIHRLASDGTTDAALPSAYSGATFVGVVIFDNAATPTAYCRGVPNEDVNDAFVLKNVNAGTVTAALNVRGRTVEPAA